MLGLLGQRLLLEFPFLLAPFLTPELPARPPRLVGPLPPPLESLFFPLGPLLSPLPEPLTLLPIFLGLERPFPAFTRGAISTGDPKVARGSIPSERGCTCIRGLSTGPNTVSTLPMILPPDILMLAPSLGAFPSKETSTPPSWEGSFTLPEKLI